jgi:K+-sensing histidine kinase KdpD
VLSLFRHGVANTNAALGLVLLIVAAASTGIRAAGMAAALSSAVWFDFFLTEPYDQFAVTKRADVETAVLLLLVGLAVSEIALWGRRQQAQASREQGYLDGVVSTAATVGAGRTSTPALIDHVSRQLVDVLQIDACRFDHGGRPVLAELHDDASVSYDGHPLDVSGSGLPTDTEIALMIRSGGMVRGRFLLVSTSRVVRPTREQRRVAVALANQLGAALVPPDGAAPGRTGSAR